MYVCLSESFLEKNKEEAKQEAITELGKDDNNSLLFSELPDTINDFAIDNNVLTIGIDTKLGFFSIDITLDAEKQELLLSMVIKQMNKIRTMLETLK
jgi:hypothetical protein